MRKHGNWLMLLVVLLVVPALACSLVTGSDSEATPAPPATVDEAEAGTVEESDGGTTAEGAGPPEGSVPEIGSLVSSLEQYNSYRIKVDMNFDATGESGASGAIRLESARIVQPPASSVTVHFEGSMLDEVESLEGDTTLSFVEVGDSTYTVLPGFGCVSGSSAEAAGSAEEFESLTDADELLGQLNDAEYVGEDSVNGQAVHHYRFDESDLAQAQQDLREVNGDLYISQEGNYLVRMVFDGRGTIAFFDQQAPEDGTVHVEYNVLDVGADFGIQVPEDCEEGSSAFPVIEGATDLSTFSGFTSYKVDASVEEAATFYQEQMTALGYEPAEEQMMLEDSAMLFFNDSEGSEITVTITAEEGGVTVLVAGGSQE